VRLVIDQNVAGRVTELLHAAALPQIAGELDAGCILVRTRYRVRIRPLPIERDT
jgi:hypothetical protein